MVSGMRTPSPTPHPPTGRLGGKWGGASAPWGWLGRGRAGGGSSANVGCVGEQRALRHLPAPQGWGLTPHLIRGAPPLLGGRGRARGTARAPCSRQAWLAARHLLPRRLAPRHQTVHPGTCSSCGAGGRTVPAASSPLRQTGPGARRPPGTAGTPSWALAAERGRCGRTARPPALPGVPAAEPRGSAPVGLGHEQGLGPSCSAPGLQQNRRGPGPPAELALR